MSSPRVAGAKAFEGQPATFEGSMFLYSLQAVSAAGGCKAAFGAKKRRDGTLVKANNSDKQYGK